MTAPCKNCETRKVGCHSACEKYIAWRVEHRKETKKRKEQAEALDAQIRGLERMKKKRGR